MNPLALPSRLASRTLDDLGEVGAALRAMTRLPELLEGRLGTIERHMVGMDRTTEEMVAILPRQIDSIESLKPELVRNREAAERLHPELVQVREGIATLAGEIAAVRAAVEPLAGQLTSVDEGVDPLDGRMAELQAGIDGMREELTELREALVPLQPAAERMGRLADRLPGA